MSTHLEGGNIDEIINFHCPRFNELPHLPLYKDQVITYIEEVLKAIHINSDEKLLTPTMVNNYVKQKVVAPPKDKKYNETHLAYLIVVCIFKQVFSLTEICNLINIQIKTCPIEQAYDFFCTELEIILKDVFTKRQFAYESSIVETTNESEVVRSSVMSFANKIYIQKYLSDFNEIEK